MFPKIKAFFHKKKLMFRLHVSFRETIHPVKVHWFPLLNLTLTLMAVKLRSLRSRDRHKGQRQCGSPMECSPGELGEFIKASTWVGKKCRKQKPKRKKNKRGKKQKQCALHTHTFQTPPSPQGVFRRNKFSMRIARMAKIWSFRRLWKGWEFFWEPMTWDTSTNVRFWWSFTVFLLSFLSKKDSQCQFLSEKKMQRKKDT